MKLDPDGYKAAVEAHFRASDNDPAIEHAIEAYIEAVEAKKEPELDQEAVSAAVRTLQSSNAYRSWRHRVQDAIRAYLAALPKGEPLADWERDLLGYPERPIVNVVVECPMSESDVRVITDKIASELRRVGRRGGLT